MPRSIASSKASSIIASKLTSRLGRSIGIPLTLLVRFISIARDDRQPLLVPARTLVALSWRSVAARPGIPRRHRIQGEHVAVSRCRRGTHLRRRPGIVLSRPPRRLEVTGPRNRRWRHGRVHEVPGLVERLGVVLIATGVVHVPVLHGL